MIDVKTARDIEELKRQTFVNFRDIDRKMRVIDENVVDFGSETVKSPTAPGGNIFDTVYLKDSGTYITRNGSGDLVFHDANTGSVTLAQIKILLAILWTYGDALGIKMKNLAGTELMVGITEDADGVAIFNDTSEVE